MIDTEQRTCPHCEGQFETQYPDKVYCSPACRAAAGRQRAAEPPHPRRHGTCVDCGVEFITRIASKRYCSAKCQRRAHDRRRDQRRRDATRANRPPTRRDAVLALRDGNKDSLSLLRQFVDTSTNGQCWIWTGSVTNEGYAQFGTARIHRLVARHVHGDLHDEPVHHICANRACVSPDHLKPISHAENIAEMMQRNFYEGRIAALEAALAEWAPLHPLLHSARRRTA